MEQGATPFLTDRVAPEGIGRTQTQFPPLLPLSRGHPAKAHTGNGNQQAKKTGGTPSSFSRVQGSTTITQIDNTYTARKQGQKRQELVKVALFSFMYSRAGTSCESSLQRISCICKFPERNLSCDLGCVEFLVTSPSSSHTLVFECQRAVYRTARGNSVQNRAAITTPCFIMKLGAIKWR